MVIDKVAWHVNPEQNYALWLLSVFGELRLPSVESVSVHASKPLRISSAKGITSAVESIQYRSLPG